MTAQNDLNSRNTELSKTNIQLNRAKKQELTIKKLLTAKESELQQTSAKNEDTKAEIVNVQELVAIAGQLRNQSLSDSDEALRLAAVSFNIDNHELKQALLLSAKSQVYQKLKDWSNAKNDIQESLSNLSQADLKKLDYSQVLQVQVLVYKTQGDQLVQNKQTHKAIKSYKEAFNILKTHPKETDFAKDNQLLTGETIERFYRNLRELMPQDKEVEASLTQHLYAQLAYFLKVKNWEAADGETYKLMLNIAKREKARYLDYEQINNFSCPDLQRIDQLWVSYSDKLFGFSVQKEIWISTNNRLVTKPEEWTDKDTKNYENFAKRVGWDGYINQEQKGSSRDSLVIYDELINSIKDDPISYRGRLPSVLVTYNELINGINANPRLIDGRDGLLIKPKVGYVFMESVVQVFVVIPTFFSRCDL